MKNTDLSDGVPGSRIPCVLVLLAFLASVGTTACDLPPMPGSGEPDTDEIEGTSAPATDSPDTDPAWIQRLEPDEVGLNKDRAGIVKLKWSTQSEENNFGFNIFRSDEKNGQYEIVNQKVIMGAGNSSTKNTYIYYDKSVRVGKEYYYYLEEIDFDGISRKITPDIKKSAVILYLSDNDPERQESAGWQAARGCDGSFGEGGRWAGRKGE